MTGDTAGPPQDEDPGPSAGQPESVETAISATPVVTNPSPAALDDNTTAEVINQPGIDVDSVGPPATASAELAVSRTIAINASNARAGAGAIPAVESVAGVPQNGVGVGSGVADAEGGDTVNFDSEKAVQGAVEVEAPAAEPGLAIAASLAILASAAPSPALGSAGRSVPSVGAPAPTAVSAAGETEPTELVPVSAPAHTPVPTLPVGAPAVESVPVAAMTPSQESLPVLAPQNSTEPIPEPVPTSGLEVQAPPTVTASTTPPPTEPSDATLAPTQTNKSRVPAAPVATLPLPQAPVAAPTPVGDPTPLPAPVSAEQSGNASVPNGVTLPHVAESAVPAAAPVAATTETTPAASAAAPVLPVVTVAAHSGTATEVAPIGLSTPAVAVGALAEGATLITAVGTGTGTGEVQQVTSPAPEAMDVDAPTLTPGTGSVQTAQGAAPSPQAMDVASVDAVQVSAATRPASAQTLQATTAAPAPGVAPITAGNGG
ncbi:unnamed protein product, partial [Discosporangium mesarthrocarpum]